MDGLSDALCTRLRREISGMTLYAAAAHLSRRLRIPSMFYNAPLPPKRLTQSSRRRVHYAERSKEDTCTTACNLEAAV